MTVEIRHYALLPNQIRESTIDYLRHCVVNIKVSLLFRFQENDEQVEFSDEQFRELASKLKNSVYPMSLIYRGKNNQISSECILINEILGGFSVRIWKSQNVTLEGSFLQVVSSVPIIQDALVEAFRDCTINFKKMTPEFYEQRMDNLIINDKIRMNGSGRSITSEQLFRTLRQMDYKYRASYSFVHTRNSQAALERIQSEYEIDVKILKQGKMNKPRITLNTTTVKVMGGLPIYMFLDFRYRFGECFREVSGERL